MDAPSAELLAFAEDPGAFLALGSDQERVRTDRYSVTFTPGAHFWSTSVERVRLAADVEEAVAEVRGLMAERGRAAAVWLAGPSSTPSDLTEHLLAAGMEAEYRDGSTILVLTEPPPAGSSPFDVRWVATYGDQRAVIEVGIEAFGFDDMDAEDERQRACDTFRAERSGGHTFRLLALDCDRPVATLQAWRSPFGLYVGGAATVPSDRRRGAMCTLLTAVWREAVRGGTPALAAHGGHMSTALMERLGFIARGRVQHLIDRPGP